MMTWHMPSESRFYCVFQDVGTVYPGTRGLVKLLHLSYLYGFPRLGPPSPDCECLCIIISVLCFLVVYYLPHRSCKLSFGCTLPEIRHNDLNDQEGDPVHGAQGQPPWCSYLLEQVRPYAPEVHYGFGNL